MKINHPLMIMVKEQRVVSLAPFYDLKCILYLDSTLVKLVCGTDNVVESVTEPNRCEYEMVFSTPVICKSPEHYAQQEHDEL